MPKSSKTLGFRPTHWQERAIASAAEATGLKSAELIGLCVDRAIAEVVENLQWKQESAVEKFHAVLFEPGSPMAQKKKKKPRA